MIAIDKRIASFVPALALTASALLFAPAATATIIASDDFGSPGELDAQTGGTGWSGSWTAVTGVTHVVDPPVDLRDESALQFSGNSNAAAYRRLGTTFVGDSLFVDFFVQVGAGSLTANDFLGLWLDTGAGGDHTSVPNIGIKSDGSGNNDVFARTTGTSGAWAANSDIGSTNGSTYHIVGRLSRSTQGYYSRFDLWLDPLLGDFGTPDASFAAPNGLAKIDYVGFRTANLDAGDLVLVDDLQLSTTWNEALRVPSPATIGLFGLGLVGLGAIRRKKPVS